MKAVKSNMFILACNQIHSETIKMLTSISKTSFCKAIKPYFLKGLNENCRGPEV